VSLINSSLFLLVPSVFSFTKLRSAVLNLIFL